jgi:glyoxylase-like metal-dependent hydrolase (beta-lactamase superfamily II)
MLTVKIFTFNPLAENTYIVHNEQRQAVIIDPGCYFEYEKQEVKKYLENNGLNLIQLLNTHCHLDHIFANNWIYLTYGLELFIHAEEELVLKFGPQTAHMWGLSLEQYDGPLHFLSHHDVVTVGVDQFKVLLAPGHSPGSVCFYNEEGNFVIGGDVLFRESIGRTDLPGGNHAALLNSIRQQLFVLDDDIIVYPGHGGPTTIGYEKKHNPFLQH